MNRYGILARDHWKTHLLERYRALPDPETFFTDLGEQIQERVDELTEARRPQLDTDYMRNLQNLNWAKKEAEDEALRELAFLAPEEESP
jgi:hypothetical protein